MVSERVTVSKALYVSALADAIDWTKSLIQAGNPSPADRERLARYQKAYTRMTGRRHGWEPQGRSITLTELAAARDKSSDEEPSDDG